MKPRAQEKGYGELSVNGEVVVRGFYRILVKERVDERTVTGTFTIGEKVSALDVQFGQEVVGDLRLANGDVLEVRIKLFAPEPKVLDFLATPKGHQQADSHFELEPIR